MSQQFNILHAMTVVAAAAITANRMTDIDGTVTAAGARGLGLAQRDAAIGEAVAVTTLGPVPATAGGAFSAKDELEVGAGGKLVVLNTGRPVAYALEDADADGDVVQVLLR